MKFEQQYQRPENDPGLTFIVHAHNMDIWLSNDGVSEPESFYSMCIADDSETDPIWCDFFDDVFNLWLGKYPELVEYLTGYYHLLPKP